MKNIIFNVFGEDMSTGVVTQVKFLTFVRKPVTAEVLEKVMMKLRIILIGPSGVQFGL